MPSPAKRNAGISQGFEAFFKGAPEGCIRLTVGEPDFPTPQEVVQAAKDDLDAGDTHYVATAGKQVLLDAIQEKLKREQEAEQMKFVLQKEQQEAERKRIEAQGIADFQRIVATNISDKLLQWKGIEATEKLALSQNSKVVVIGNPKSGLPIILGSDGK